MKYLIREPWSWLIVIADFSCCCFLVWIFIVLSLFLYKANRFCCIIRRIPPLLFVYNIWGYQNIHEYLLQFDTTPLTLYVTRCRMPRVTERTRVFRSTNGQYSGIVVWEDRWYICYVTFLDKSSRLICNTQLVDFSLSFKIHT